MIKFHQYTEFYLPLNYNQIYFNALVSTHYFILDVTEFLKQLFKRYFFITWDWEGTQMGMQKSHLACLACRKLKIIFNILKYAHSPGYTGY